MKKIRKKNSNSEKGFAMLDVMIATLVLAVGVIAFIKLQNTNVNRSASTNYRLQAVASANAMIETLRSDRLLVTYLAAQNTAEPTNGGSIISHGPAAATDVIDRLKCTSGKTSDGGKTIAVNDPETWCEAGTAAPDLNKIREDFIDEMGVTLSKNFHNVPGKAILCLNIEDVTQHPTQVRVTVVWKKATQEGFAIVTDEDCPGGMDAGRISKLTAAEEEAKRFARNSDRGYYDIFTRI